ncbi:putative 3-dehydroquinate synthase II [Medicago truncatula]|uniref:3-dehydroquinate synthase n=1 Tax=Medicago truncatula TaxID=3880 RepID=G7IDE5_MEDTR|nr:3-dehydroquinate synthase homolog [Medicago truncatula]XP_024640911.1 3-dehydroquinate synthase homolog [Medicago truncatula]XP_024640955.1 3-dehydroquinate synthase homolog [Medicago truncatula]AES60076.2 3-dehydroquinate synthase [Medicago truncatula]RHN78433.1 putative 3-dehydroquinate synthase II [Medicago truncatula]
MSLLSQIGFAQFTPPPSTSYTRLHHKPCSSSMSSSSWTPLEDSGNKKSKKVWIWTKNKQVMTAAVERGWNTFIFPSNLPHLANDWSSIAVICPLFASEKEILDAQNKKVATIFDVSTPEELERLRPEDEQAENIVVNLLDWQVIPAENIIAAFQNSQKTVFAISDNASEAQTFLEALEHGLDGIVLKVEDVEPMLELKEYFDRRTEESNVLNLTKATVTQIQVAGMGDRVCVDLCSLMRPGEGLLVGSFARGLFLVHSECLESNYIASRPFRVNAGPVHAYIAVPGGRTSYLSELKSGKEVIVVDQQGRQRIAIVGRVKIESRPLILVEAKTDSDNQTISILLQNAETVALVCPVQGNKLLKTAFPVTSLKVGDEVLLRVQGGARHTGIEIQEFIVEK